MIEKFSKKQLKMFSWWMDESPVHKCNGIVSEGSIRSGKTHSMIGGFLLWAMSKFNNKNFAVCGKTISAFKRNVYGKLKDMATLLGYDYTEKLSENRIDIKFGNIVNSFYIFAGNDEKSQDIIQGIDLAGIFFDEVALMPESFVNQGTGRCSIDGSKYWFNCNPEGPNHYFKKEWIDKSEEKKLYVVKWNMDDNPSLSDEIKERYKSLYSGVFYQRYILGMWALAEGLIYSMFDEDNMYDDETRPKGLQYLGQRTIACDYGTYNPCVFLDGYDLGDTIYIDNLYYYDGRAEKRQKTDTEYANDMAEFMGKDRICDIVVDPSASSFITELRHRGYIVKEADNSVLDGIRTVSNLLAKKKIKINKKTCEKGITELQSYVWDDKAGLIGKEQPIKANDHFPDALRYYIYTCIARWRISEYV